MSQQLIGLNSDLKQLRDEGYELEIFGGYLITHHIPYINCDREIKYGKLIVPLNINGNVVQYSGNHVINFMGDYPCNKNGSEILAIRHSVPNIILPNGIKLNYSFSNKPQNGYKDYYHQVTRYIDIISSPAISTDKSATAKTFKIIEGTEKDVFQYIDTNSSKANIYHVNNKFRNQKIAIIGLGGTGSYILDFVAKTPVAEIHLYDGDVFLQHNAFRAPSAPCKEVLDMQKNKVDYFSEIYSNMHKGIIPHSEYVTLKNIDALADISYVFVCIDNNTARKKIITTLANMQIIVIDVGIGVELVEDKLIGSIRTTTVLPSKRDHMVKRIPMVETEDENEYSSNIQIADLNALNAINAVIKWKKLSGFYQDLENECHSVYTINDSHLLNEDILDT